MLSEKMEKALNAQLNAELFSSYLYYSMSTYFESRNLRGFAHWMRVQAQEELVHVQKIYGFLYDRRSRVELDAIEKPPTDWSSPLAAFEAAFDHERKITGRIDDLVALSQQEKDNATYHFLQWFVEEQVEEESTVDDVVQILNLVDGAAAGLFMLDQRLGSRTTG